MMINIDNGEMKEIGVTLINFRILFYVDVFYFLMCFVSLINDIRKNRGDNPIQDPQVKEGAIRLFNENTTLRALRLN
jgi:hypothetical protein